MRHLSSSEQGECPWGELAPEQLTNVVGFQVQKKEGEKEGGRVREEMFNKMQSSLQGGYFHTCWHVAMPPHEA